VGLDDGMGGGGSVDSQQHGSYSHRVGARLREVRIAREMSLFDVECASGRKIKASILGSYERSERVINVDRLAQLATFYQVEVSELLPPVMQVAPANPQDDNQN
jgi:transcriptional regulator with XRE-family HTH domain